MSRLFVAVWPSAEIVAALRALPREHHPNLRWTKEDQWHVTLRFFGEADEAAATEALGAVQHPAVTATAGPAVHHLGSTVLVVPVAGLDGVAAAVVGATAAVGTAPDPRPFNGHVTVARVRNRARVLVPHTPISGSWPVTEVTLVRSTPHPDGSRYEVVSTVPLRPAADPTG